MAKNRKYATETLIKVVEDYIQYKANYQRITYTAVAQYCKTNYSFMSDVTYQDFSRNIDVKDFIETYNINLERRLLDIDTNETVVQDKLIDSRTLYGKTNKEIDQVISHINEYLASVYANDRKAVKSNYRKLEMINSLKKNNKELEEQNNRLNIDNANIKRQLAEERRKKKELTKKTNELIRYIEHYIYDPEVQKHLVEIGLLVEKEADCLTASGELMNTSLEAVIEKDIVTAGEDRALQLLSRL